MNDIVYFDNAATTFPKPEEVYLFMDSFYRECGVNVGRGQYRSASKAFALTEETRELVLDLFHCENKKTVFTSTATEALNILLFGLHIPLGANVYISPFEHNAVTRTLFHLQKSTAFEIKFLDVDRSTLKYDIQAIEKSNTSPDPEPTSENIIEAKEALEEQGVENPTDSEAITYFNNKVNIKYSNKSSNPLFDAETQFGDKIILTINKGHPFYTHFVEPLETQSNDNGNITDPNFKTTFELFIASLVKAKYESNPEYIATIDYLLNEWDYKLRKYIITQYGLGN